MHSCLKVLTQNINVRMCVCTLQVITKDPGHTLAVTEE